MLIKRFAENTLVVLLAVLLVFTGTIAHASVEPDISAASAVLLERDSGRILFWHNADKKRPMASTTKIMTAIIALEQGNLQDQISVSYNAASIEGSSIWLEPEEIKTLNELLYGLMLRSGNDAATAIAEYIAGSVPEFAAMMTAKAAAIGACNTSFRNPHGLDADGHYTTAYDLGLIAAYALKIPQFRKIIATEQISISWPGHEWDRTLRNQNKLLELYEGANGVKTGWTTPAGRCFVGSAAKEGMQLVAVVLNAPNMWEDTIALLDYGFKNYTLENVIGTGRAVKTAKVTGGRLEQVTVTAGRDLLIPLASGEKQKLSYSFKIDEPLKAPLVKGNIIGSLEASLNGNVIGSIPLLAGENVPKARFLEPFLKFFSQVVTGGNNND